MARDKFGFELRQRIVTAYSSGLSQKCIAEKYTVHKSSISRIINNYKKNSQVSVIHRGGRSRKTSDRTDKLIIRHVKKDPFISSSKIVERFQLPVSARTIRRRLLQASLCARRPAKKPLISKRNQKKRLEFAKAHINWTESKWRTILFSDESKFNIIGSDGMCYVRRPEGKRLEARYCKKTVKHGGGNIMVWGCFSGAGVGPLHRIVGIMDRFMYKDILQRIMLPYAEYNMPLRWVFQQDNDPKHASKVVKSWFADNRVTVMEWPPQSPDLNPIENLWEIVNKKIDRENCTSLDVLFCRLEDAWKSIPKSVIDHLIASMPRRCQAVIDNNGFATKY